MLPSRPGDLPLAKALEKKTPLVHLMLLNALVDVAMIALIPVVTRLTCGSRLRDFGVSLEGWWRQAAVGVVATLIAAPPVFAVQLLATRIWHPHAHPVQEMIFKEFSLGVAGLAIVTAVVVAPLFEELAFRGLLQSWLVAALAWRDIPAPTSSAEPTSFPLITEVFPAIEPWDGEPAHEPGPGDEVGTVLNIPQALEMRSTKPASRAWLAIVLTSVLFAAVHAPQWPAPIALFALALVIGTVYYRTGSLIAAIFMHATFNGISTLLLFGALLSGHQPEPRNWPQTWLLTDTNA